jgi:hypothetical protein
MTVEKSVLRDASRADAGYGLALRVTGEPERAAAAVEAADPLSGRGDAEFLRAVRREARALRPDVPWDPETVARPAQLNSLPIADWAVLERVALRGMTVDEAAAAVGIDRREALLRLHRGLVTAGRRLRQAGDDTDAVRLDGLGGDLAAGGLDDAAGNGQPQAAPVPGLAS